MRDCERRRSTIDELAERAAPPGRDHDTIDALMAENRTFPPSEAFKADALVRTRSCTTRRRRTTKASGRGRPPTWSTGPSRGTRRSTGSCPYAKWFVGGKLNVAAQLPRPARRSPARATRSPSTGRASPATPARSPTPSCSTRCQRFANVLKSLGVAQGRPGQHLPADDPRGRGGDAGLRPHRRRRTAWCSAGSRRRRWPTGSTTPRPRCSITADGGYRRGAVFPLKAGRRRGLRRRRPRSSTSSSCGAAATTSRWSRAATTGTTT